MHLNTIYGGLVAHSLVNYVIAPLSMYEVYFVSPTGLTVSLCSVLRGFGELEC